MWRIRHFNWLLLSPQVDKLEECEAARLEEKKEEEYKPVVMGKSLVYFLWIEYIIFLKKSRADNPIVIKEEEKKFVLRCGCQPAVWSHSTWITASWYLNLGTSMLHHEDLTGILFYLSKKLFWWLYWKITHSKQMWKCNSILFSAETQPTLMLTGPMGFNNSAAPPNPAGGFAPTGNSFPPGGMPYQGYSM